MAKPGKVCHAEMTAKAMIEQVLMFGSGMVGS
jgi:hypothetical protein